MVEFQLLLTFNYVGGSYITCWTNERNIVIIVTVTRLIRIRYGDYSLQTIPPGMAIEVPYKPIHKQQARGPLAPIRKPTMEKEEESPGDVRWVRSIQ